VKSTVRVLESFVQNPGEHLTEAITAGERMEFKTVKLLDVTKQKVIDKQQFMQSIDNLHARLCELDEENAQILHDILVFDTATWPTLPDIHFGEKEVCRLCERINFEPREAIVGMREFVSEKPADIPDGLTKLHVCLKTLLCSTAECERGFSLMNIISTDLRSVILVEKPFKFNACEPGWSASLHVASRALRYVLAEITPIG